MTKAHRRNVSNFHSSMTQISLCLHSLIKIINVRGMHKYKPFKLSYCGNVNEGSDQTELMPRLIAVFAGHKHQGPVVQN